MHHMTSSEDPLASRDLHELDDDEQDRSGGERQEPQDDGVVHERLAIEPAHEARAAAGRAHRE